MALRAWSRFYSNQRATVTVSQQFTQDELNLGHGGIKVGEGLFLQALN